MIWLLLSLLILFCAVIIVAGLFLFTTPPNPEDDTDHLDHFDDYDS